jgi:hypothetical protein
LGIIGFNREFQLLDRFVYENDLNGREMSNLRDK